LAEQYGVEKMEGVLVSEVEQGSAAERKGIRVGDVITDVAGKPVNNIKQFQQVMKTWI
jgi:S1-C subfamily serine protease